MTAFFRFPHTPHLAWLATGRPRDDKVLSPAEAEEFLSGVIAVEEKVDGANLGFSVDDAGELRAQNRGSYVTNTGQWKPLAGWIGPRRSNLAEALFPHLMLFGEWCYATHSVRYSHLPDWFLAFDVYDREREYFWSSDKRDALASELGLATVPHVATGHYALSGLKKLLARSQLADGPAEGLYLRRETEGQVVSRAKLVRPEFTQSIVDHWSRRAIVSNQLAADRRAHRTHR